MEAAARRRTCSFQEFSYRRRGATERYPNSRSARAGRCKWSSPSPTLDFLLDEAPNPESSALPWEWDDLHVHAGPGLRAPGLIPSAAAQRRVPAVQAAPVMGRRVTVGVVAGVRLSHRGTHACARGATPRNTSLSSVESSYVQGGRVDAGLAGEVEGSLRDLASRISASFCNQQSEQRLSLASSCAARMR